MGLSPVFAAFIAFCAVGCEVAAMVLPWYKIKYGVGEIQYRWTGTDNYDWKSIPYSKNQEWMFVSTCVIMSLSTFCALLFMIGMFGAWVPAFTPCCSKRKAISTASLFGLVALLLCFVGVLAFAVFLPVAFRNDCLDFYHHKHTTFCDHEENKSFIGDDALGWHTWGPDTGYWLAVGAGGGILIAYILGHFSSRVGYSRI